MLRLDQLQFLDATPEREPFDGDPARFRLGLEAARLGLAYEYDPYFSLSISRVDPLPHQLEAEWSGRAPARQQLRLARAPKTRSTPCLKPSKPRSP